ncbi:MAG: glycoside hydrolase family 88 protein [Mangrovibacterium sp.]
MQKFCHTLILLIAFVVYGRAQYTPDVSFHIYILMGQSNMAGRGEITEEFRNESNPNVFMLNKENQWVIASHPLHFDKPTVAGVGPGLAFGLNMAKADPSVKIGLVPCAVGGTSIEHWQPGAYDKKTKTHPYDDALVRIKEAMKSGVVKGVLWHQGEADRGKSSTYLLHLSGLIERIRNEVNDPRLPFVAGELGRYISQSNNINDELAKLSAQVPYTAVTASEGLVHKGDGTHFDSFSAEKLGQRFTQKMQEVQKQLATEAIVRKVADNVVEGATFRFKDRKTGKVYGSVKEMELTPDIRVESWANSFQYVNGILTTGMVQASDVLNDDKYVGFSQKNFRFIFENVPYIEPLYQAGVDEDYAFRRFYDMEYRDGCCAIANGLADIDWLTTESEFRKYLDRAAAFIFDTHKRLPDGTLARDWPHDRTVWADDLYMAVPFLARMGKITGEEKYFDEAIKQVENYNKHLYDPTTGLYFHCWYSDVGINGVARWGRSNGWLVVAQTELLNFLPEGHPKRTELIKLLLRQIVGFSRYQDPLGLWHQLLDKPDSYLETSVTAMFVYAVARAVNQGWIPPVYFTVAERGWEGLVSKITPEGKVKDVCVGTGISEDISFYYNRPVTLNGNHALGAVLLAGSEMIRAYKLQHKTIVKGGGY